VHFARRNVFFTESLANLLQITAKRSKVILPLRKGILLQKKGNITALAA
jgi:hypothetical protein